MCYKILNDKNTHLIAWSEILTQFGECDSLTNPACAVAELGARSALVNIRRKTLSSSVGFRKRMTSRSPQSLICDPSAVRSSISDLFDFC